MIKYVINTEIGTYDRTICEGTVERSKSDRKPSASLKIQRFKRMAAKQWYKKLVRFKQHCLKADIIKSMVCLRQDH